MEQSGRSLHDYIDIIIRRKWILVVSTVVCTAVAALYALSLPSYYSSSTMILIERQQIPESYIKPTDMTPLSTRLNTLSQQIMSRTRLEEIAEEFNLFKDSATDEGLPATVKNFFGLGGRGEPSRSAVVEQMRKNIDVKVIADGAVRKAGYRNPDAFSISYVAKDPETAMKVTKKLASLFIEENVSTREKYAEETSKFLDNELKKARAELKRQETALKEFKQKHMGALPEQLDANLRTLDRLQLELQTVNVEIANQEDKIQLLESQIGPARDPDTATGLKGELIKLKKELRRLRSVYKDNYPDVIITKNRIRELEAKLEGMKDEAASDEEAVDYTELDLNNRISAAKAGLRNLEQRKREVRKQINIYERRVEVTPANEQRLAEIQRGYNISLQNYRTLLEKKLNARLAENLEKKQKGERFRVLDPAYLPEAPFKPDRIRLVMQGTGAGMALGILIIMALEFMNPAFSKPEDFAEIFTIPVLASIPKFPTSRNAGRKRKA